MTVTFKQFVEKAKAKHGDRFEYDESSYVSISKKLSIRCSKHGWFDQIGTDHVRLKFACKECAKEQKTQSKPPIAVTRNTFFDFKIKAIHNHGNKFEYDKTSYINMSTPIRIKCPDHEWFTQTPKEHIRNKYACKQCGIEASRMTYTEFVKESEKIHGDKYAYLELTYTSAKRGVDIYCPDHGWFKQEGRTHLKGSGCSKCGNTSSNEARTYDTNYFIEKAKDIHDDYYDYSRVEYVNSKRNVVIECPVHGEFKQTPYIHLRGHGCMSCNNPTSKIENEIQDLFKGISTRQEIPPYEIDAYREDLKAGIEFNGSYWHSNEHKSYNYHQKKWQAAQDKGIRLMQVWEHDWLNPSKRMIIQSRIKVMMGEAERVAARKCEVYDLTYDNVKQFYNHHHLQEAGLLFRSDAHIGLVHNDELVMAVSVRNHEVVRMATRKNLVVVGGSSKLLSKLPLGTYHSWINNDYGGTSAHYDQFNSRITKVSAPNYKWVSSNKKHVLTRNACQKHRLVERGFDPSMSEAEIMKSQGYMKCYDSGNTLIEFTV